MELFSLLAEVLRKAAPSGEGGTQGATGVAQPLTGYFTFDKSFPSRLSFSHPIC